jgi:alpha-tubulin suppressor-like RCC1 family protein
MSVTNAIDYKKVGYRWKGEYSALNTYENNDVVHKEGAAWKYNSSSNAFEIFARGNIDALVRGEIITGGNYTTTGVTSEVLVVNSSGTEVEFNHRMDRNGQRVTQIASYGISEGYRMGHLHAANYFSGLFLMNDGTVRGVGYNHSGELGTGNIDGDVGRTPNVIPFPKGTRIKKIFGGQHSNFYIDTDDRLWANGHYQALGMSTSTYQNFTGSIYSSSHLEVPLCLHEVMPSVFTANDKIVAVVSYWGQYGSHHGTFAFSDTGKVWSAGHNGNGQLGIGTNTDTWDFTLIELTQDVPMDGVTCAPWGAASGLRAVNGDYYEAGWPSLLWGNTDTNVFRKVEAAGKIKMAQMSYQRQHNSTSDYYGHVLVQENGDLWLKQNNPAYVNVGSSGINGLTNSSTNYLDSRLNDSLWCLGQGVKRAWFTANGYNELIVEMENGDYRHRGNGGYQTGPTYNTNSLPTNGTDFTTNNKFLFDQNYYNSNITKFINFGGNIYRLHGALDNQGRLFLAGYNSKGILGNGVTYSMGPSANYNITTDNAGYDIYSNNSLLRPTHTNGYPYVPIRDAIVDFQIMGRLYYVWNVGEYNQAYCYALTDKGDVYAWGDSGHHNFLNTTNSDQYSPAKLIF